MAKVAMAKVAEAEVKVAEAVARVRARVRVRVRVKVKVRVRVRVRDEMMRRLKLEQAYHHANAVGCAEGLEGRDVVLVVLSIGEEHHAQVRRRVGTRDGL